VTAPVPELRLIPERAADGPTNMAADEVLLESAQGGQFILRTYSWSPATLSLGYFQPAGARLRQAAWRDLPFVRRSTGGGAILHDAGELTYALALPPVLAGRHTPAEWHCLLHRLMVAALRAHGLDARVVVGPRPDKQELDFLCFAVPQPGDVVIGEKKVIGGAQRLRGGALLQHGAIVAPAQALLRAKLPGALARHFGARLVERDFTALEWQRVHALVRERFGSANWNLKR
jgi:lipoate-protein ligase A